VDADHFPDGTFTFPLPIKWGCFNINTLFSIGVIRVSLPYVVPKLLFNKATPEVNPTEPLTTFRYQKQFYV
jgi:hypothetical protein